MRDGEFFVGREEQQKRFRAALHRLADESLAHLDGASIFMLYGHGGVGKSWLLRRYAVIASGDRSAGESLGQFAVVTVDWELEQRRNPAQFHDVTGPPIWRVLDRLYRGLVDSVSSKDRRRVERAFTEFRRQMTRQPALMERARALGLDGLVGRRRLGDDERAQLTEALTKLAGAGLSAKLGPVGTSAATVGMVGITAAARRLIDRVGRLEPEAYASLSSEVDALVHAFGRGLETVGRKTGPVVLLLDSCELLGETVDWLAELVLCSGSRMAWVLCIRQDVMEPVSGDSAVGRLAARMQQQVELLPLLPFSPGEMAEYLRRSFPEGLPEGATIERIVSGTGSVPLALSLVTSLLRRGDPADEVFDTYGPVGSGRQVVAALMQRYLARLDGSADAAEDRHLVYGLALLENGLDAGVLAALWDVAAADLSSKLDRLRRRYDFVRNSNQPLHPDVQAAVLGYLRGPVERESVRVMNERAAAVVRARLSEGPLVVESRVADEDWQRNLRGLLWHTFWMDARTGHRLLCHVFAPVAVLDAALAVELTQLAFYFVHAYASADRDVLHELALLASRPFSAEGHSRPLPTVMRAVTSHAAEGIFDEETDRQRFVDMLVLMHGDLFGQSLVKRLEVAEHLLSRLDIGGVADEGSAARRNVTVLHSRLTNWIAVQHLTVENSPVDQELALRAARRGVEVNPREPTAHVVLGALLVHLGQPAAAEAALREARRLDPNNPDRAGIFLATALGMQGRHAEGVEVLRKTVAITPEEDSVVPRLLLGRVLLGEGIRTGSLAAIDEAVDTLRVAARVQPENLEVFTLLGSALILSGRFGSAEITIRQALAIDRQVGLLNQLGVILSQLARFTEALEIYREAIELEPGNSEAYAGLAAALGVLGDAAGAERANREALRLDPDNLLAHENLAVSLMMQGRQPEAAQSQQQAAEIRARRSSSDIFEFYFDTRWLSDVTADEMRADTAMDRIAHLMAIGRDEDAIRELTKLMDQHPTDVALRTILGSLLNTQHRPDEAEPILRTAIAADPDDAVAHVTLARTLHLLRRRTEAVQMARAAARLGADNGEVLALAAAILDEAGLHDEAIMHGMAADQLRPNNVDTKVNLALSLRMTGRLQEAERLLNDAVAINDRDLDAYADLGEVQLFLGRYDAALRSLQRAADLNDAEQTAKVHTLLEGLKGIV